MKLYKDKIRKSALPDWIMHFVMVHCLFLLFLYAKSESALNRLYNQWVISEQLSYNTFKDVHLLELMLLIS